MTIEIGQLVNVFQKKTDRMIKKTIWIALMLSLLAVLTVIARADEQDKQIPVAAAVQTTPVEHVATVATVPNNSSLVAGSTGVKQTGRQLPKTASVLPLIALIGLGCIGVAFSLMVFVKRAPASAV